MSVTWPPSLPQFDQSGFEEIPGSNVVSTQMDAGPVKKRKRFTAAVDAFKGKLLLTKAQYETLKTFYKTTCSYGTEDIDISHPLTEAAVTVQFAQPPRFLQPRGEYLWVEVAFEVQP